MNNRVMVLDDDEDILEIITYILTEEGYEVLRLITAEMCSATFARSPPT